jgi:hypothetical protein
MFFRDHWVSITMKHLKVELKPEIVNEAFSIT